MRKVHATVLNTDLDAINCLTIVSILSLCLSLFCSRSYTICSKMSKSLLSFGKKAQATGSKVLNTIRFIVLSYLVPICVVEQTRAILFLCFTLLVRLSYLYHSAASCSISLRKWARTTKILPTIQFIVLVYLSLSSIV